MRLTGRREEHRHIALRPAIGPSVQVRITVVVDAVNKETRSRLTVDDGERSTAWDLDQASLDDLAWVVGGSR